MEWEGISGHLESELCGEAQRCNFVIINISEVIGKKSNMGRGIFYNFLEIW